MKIKNRKQDPQKKAALIVDEKTDNQVVIVPIRSYC